MDNNSKSVIEYERALLGIFITSPDEFDKVKGALLAEDFFDERNRIVFQALEDLTEQGFAVEVTPIIQIIQNNGGLKKIGGQEYIDLLISEAGLRTNVRKFAEAITEKSRMRQVIAEIDSLQDEIKKKNLSADEVLQKVEMDIISNTRNESKAGFKSAKLVVEEVMEELEKKLSGELVSGIPSGFADLDKVTGGFHEGELIILAARPSMGKTALALNIAANVAKDKSVAFFSLEMGAKSLATRVIGFTGFLTSGKLQKPSLMTTSDRQKFGIATEKVSKLNINFNDASGIKLSEMVWLAKRLKKNKGLDMIVIDYLQLISAGGNGNDRQNEVATISRTLKKLARELNIPIIALSQLSRKVEQRESKVPMMSDLRESGAIEQDADLIAFVYREAYYNNKETDTENNEQQKIQVIIGKHRNGPTGVVNLSFVPQYGLFMNAPKEKINE